jgi:hypothetical protein
MDLTEKQIINFWDKVLKTETCWEWQGSLNIKGYGKFHARNKNNKIYATHRLSWILNNGEIIDNLHVLHKCDNRKCCNPDHLFLGTHRDNMDDMVNKGRSNGFDKNINIQKKATLLAKTPEAIEKKKNTFKNIEHQQKEKNSQYGTMWIYNLELQESKKINKEDVIPKGWLKGRKIKF